MVDLAKALQKYWAEQIIKNPANASSLEFLKNNQYRALELGYMALHNPSTEYLVPIISSI